MVINDLCPTQSESAQKIAIFTRYKVFLGSIQLVVGNSVILSLGTEENGNGILSKIPQTTAAERTYGFYFTANTYYISPI